MPTYGIPYQGSKSDIAEEIISALPSGKRFVDLFGGGFAISQCALFSYKYKKVLYNDINPLLIPLIKDAIAGKYSYKNFTPEWISRDEFFKSKESDGYVKWCWSFGNDGESYVYGKDIEEYKRMGHEYCVNGAPIEKLKYLNLDDDLKSIKERRLELNNGCEKELACNPDNPDGKMLSALLHIEHLGRIERLQKLENLPMKERLEFICMDYREYRYQDGDVVYCDIPYQNIYGNKANDYGMKFDSGAFYEWAVAQPYPVYFSSYSLGGIVWERDKQILLDSQSNCKYRREVVYCVDNDYQTPKKASQGFLF